MVNPPSSRSGNIEFGGLRRGRAALEAMAGVRRNGGLNALPVSPDGGYFIALSGDFQTTGLVQTLITGLVEGRTCTLSLYWGAAQEYGRSEEHTSELQSPV